MPSSGVFSCRSCESSCPLACLLSLRRSLHLDVQFRRWLREVPKQRRAEPAFHLFLLPAVDVAAAFCPRPFENDLRVGEITCRENGQESTVGVRKVSGRHVDHRVGTTDEWLLNQAHVGIIEDPQTLPLVWLDNENRVVHGESSVCRRAGTSRGANPAPRGSAAAPALRSR